MALILILCVAVPFLIAMVIIYILYGTMWNQSSDCYSLCRNMQKSAAIPGGEVSSHSVHLELYNLVSHFI
jgi:hypothetical protein